MKVYEVPCSPSRSVPPVFKAVPAYESGVPGLLVTPRINGDPKTWDEKIANPDAWVLTHEDSGGCIPIRFPSIEAAGGAARRFADLADWTRPAAELVKIFPEAGKVALAIREEAGLDVTGSWAVDPKNPPRYQALAEKEGDTA